MQSKAGEDFCRRSTDSAPPRADRVVDASGHERASIRGESHRHHCEIVALLTRVLNVLKPLCIYTRIHWQASISTTRARIRWDAIPAGGG